MNVAFLTFEKKASTMYNMISRSQDSTGSSVTIFFENGPLTYFQALFPHSEICSNIWTWMSLKLLKTFLLLGLTIKMSLIWDYTNKNLHSAKKPASDYFRMEHRWISQYCNLKHVKYFSTEISIQLPSWI